jgi:hypothetical protein
VRGDVPSPLVIETVTGMTRTTGIGETDQETEIEAIIGGAAHVLVTQMTLMDMAINPDPGSPGILQPILRVLVLGLTLMLPFACSTPPPCFPLQMGLLNQGGETLATWQFLERGRSRR